MNEAEFANLLQNATDRSLTLRILLDSDAIVGDEEIDKMSIKEMQDFLIERGIDSKNVRKLSELRMKCLEVKLGKLPSPGDRNLATQDKKEIAKREDGDSYDFFLPDLAVALSSGTEDDVNRAILKMFFEEFDPSRLNEIDLLLHKFKGEEDELFADIAWNYPEHADRLIAFSINAAYSTDNASTKRINEVIVQDETRRRPSFVVAALKL